MKLLTLVVVPKYNHRVNPIASNLKTLVQCINVYSCQVRNVHVYNLPHCQFLAPKSHGISFCYTSTTNIYY